ncbi:MAG TPA: dTDP-4-dehydrorhamnose 3,5-epimerase family protein [Gaiellaceae bacterium]|nr:dTDP-4-dehydrorhamnose 3,5-epimerase family protein [Gaiellaceae bacterium]
MTTVAGIEGLDDSRKDVASVTPEGSALQAIIDGVAVRRQPTHADERGTLTEIYDVRWRFAEDPLVYVYHVTVTPGQIKGWVLHQSQNDRIFVYAGILKVVLFDARHDSPSHRTVNVFHLGTHDRALLSIPAGVWHAVQNVGHDVAAFVNLPSRPYDHDDPDKHRLPLDNDVIPYRLVPK